jgi:hypothetical protein
MPDLEILIKTRTELAGAEQAAAALEKQIGAAKAMGKPFSDMEAQLARATVEINAFKRANEGTAVGEWMKVANEGLRDIVPGFGKLQDTVGKLTTGSLGAVSAGFMAVGAAAEVAKEGLDEYAKAEDQVVKLDAALAQAGIQVGQYRERLQELAGTMRDATGIADDEWLAVITRLTQFGADNTNIDQYTEAVKNLAGIMGGDLQGASTAFSRAMQGSFQMFSRYGIVLDESASKTEKLEQLMQTLALRGGGQLEASVNTLNGQWRMMVVQFDELKEGIGRFVAETGILQAGLTGLTVAAKFWAEMIGGTLPNISGMQNALRRSSQAMDDSRAATERSKKAMDGYKESVSKTEEALKNLNEEKREELSHAEKMDSYAKEGEMAAVDRRLALGEINPIRAAADKAMIEDKYAGRSFMRKQIEERRLQEQATEQAKKAQQEVDDINGKVSSQQARVDQANKFEQERDSAKLLARELDRARKELGDNEALGSPDTDPNFDPQTLVNRRFLAKKVTDLELRKNVALDRAIMVGAPDGYQSLQDEQRELTHLKGLQSTIVPEASKRVRDNLYQRTIIGRSMDYNKEEFQASRDVEALRLVRDVSGQLGKDSRTAADLAGMASAVNDLGKTIDQIAPSFKVSLNSLNAKINKALADIQSQFDTNR